MKKIISITLLIAFAVNLKAQTLNADSLKQQLNLKLPDTSKLNTLARLGFYYQDSKPDSLLYYGKQLLELAQHVNNLKMISVAYSTIGQYEYIVGNYSLSVQWLFKSLELAQNINDSNRIANSNNLLGNAYKEYGDYPKAIAHFSICKNIAALIHDPKQNDLFASLNLGEVYALMGVTDSGLVYAQQAYRLALKYHSRWTGATLMTLGYVYFRLNNKNLSLQYFNEGKALYEANFGNSRYLSKGTLAIAAVYKKYRQVDSAIYFAHVALNVAKQVPYLKGVGAAEKFLYDIYDSLHMNDSAFLYQKLYANIDDSLNDRAKIASFENETFIQKVREQEKEQAFKKAEKEREQDIQYALIALGIIVFVTLFLLLSRTVIVNQKVISFFAVLGLLVVFEFINLLIHPWLASFTHDSPVLMLLALVIIASLLIPLHHRLEYWIKAKIIEKNKTIRLAAEKKAIKKLEKKQSNYFFEP
ncbi:MAG TPA: tetratricopeptide repeat protein [Puia sp.]|nr:tetratricopeptide repeat protein [Puia sp.]